MEGAHTIQWQKEKEQIILKNISDVKIKYFSDDVNFLV